MEQELTDLPTRKPFYTVRVNDSSDFALFTLNSTHQASNCRVMRLVKPVFDVIDEKPLEVSVGVGQDGVVVALRCSGRMWRGAAFALTLLSKSRKIVLEDVVDVLRQYYSWDECVEFYPSSTEQDVKALTEEKARL